MFQLRQQNCIWFWSKGAQWFANETLICGNKQRLDEHVCTVNTVTIVKRLIA